MSTTIYRRLPFQKAGIVKITILTGLGNDSIYGVVSVKLINRTVVIKTTKGQVYTYPDTVVLDVTKDCK